MSMLVYGTATAFGAGAVAWQLLRPRPEGRDWPGRVDGRWVAEIRRSLPGAWVAAGAAGSSRQPSRRRLPQIAGPAEFVPYGISMRLSAPGWDITGDLAPMVPAVQSALNGRCRVGVVELQPVPGEPGIGRLTVLDREPLLTERLWTAKPGSGGLSSPRAPIVLGVGRDGRPATVNLVGGRGASRVLIGGMPGGGKSRTMHLILWQVAPLSNVRIWAVDLKGGLELGMWRPRMSGVATSVDTAKVLLEGLAARMSARAEQRAETGASATMLDFTAEEPVDLLVVDELRPLAADKDCARSLQLIAEQGRAVGHPILAAVQISTVENMPSEIRGLFDVRIAHRVATDDLAATILGSRPAKGTGPASIPGGDVGAGWAWVEDGLSDGRMIRVDHVRGDDGVRAHALACARVPGLWAAPAQPDVGDDDAADDGMAGDTAVAVRSKTSGAARRASRRRGGAVV